MGKIKKLARKHPHFLSNGLEFQHLDEYEVDLVEQNDEYIYVE